MNKRFLTKKFNLLCKAFPGLTKDATALGVGVFSLVSEHTDGTVAKFLFRQPKQEWQEHANKSVRNEIACLKLLRTAALGKLYIPVLLTKPRRLNNKNFSSYYRMTKAPGQTEDWAEMLNDKGKLKQKARRYFQQAGWTLAHFHKATAKLPTNKLANLWENEGTHIPQVSSLSNKANKALAKADEYLQARTKPGFVHGDFYGQNILSDKAGRITGLLDFARSGSCQNYLVDFRNVPNAALSCFINGYERKSGRKINADMVMMTKISGHASYINQLSERSPERDETMQELNACLAKVSHITGYKPPGL